MRYDRSMTTAVFYTQKGIKKNIKHRNIPERV